ncbi:putative neutral zinc metallopeptidase [Chryseobacterium sp. MOF25P]|uniref:KPN_02809 family neutral zinc metallopeptidase n=1 Tax=unclassified Chryseobacterium TaxID=2593645 RepID=UPI00080518EC|nr:MULTISPECIES: neutral zinc metallopeptidase [unclassified Chryseobacterium]OBW42147.1 putative neutral zinc metallopeptidase [Chryseobacterium sp. MOF25P]OBW46854.1 putative neutral zinc metallopeptidase [Chryseobacterium sp. BGARF1]
MRWTDDRGGNVEDRRGSGGAIVGGGLGTIIIAAIVFFLGGDPSAILNSENIAQSSSADAKRELSANEQKIGEMVDMMGKWNIITWDQIFKENGIIYEKPKIILFESTTSSRCGIAQSAMGPFYCPADQSIYMDMSFFNELQSRFGAKVTEFTIAYVLAHEVGHHVQNLLGTLNETDKARGSARYSEAQLNQISVATELQADFYAGVWAKKTDTNKNILEPGDLESAINAAEAVGDDNIQKRSQGYVNQESFTHGSSAQRKEWFMKGYNSGDIKQGDTFSQLLR